MNCKKGTHRTGVGLFMVVFGVLYLLANMGIIDRHVKDILFSWPMIPIFIGFVHLLKGEFGTAIVGFAIGAIFIIPDFITDLSIRDVFFSYWPILLIIGGISVLFNKRKSNDHKWDSVNTVDEDAINEEIIFSGKKIFVESKKFKGGRISALFGGAEISFVNSALHPNGAVIDISAVFGGVKLLVPRDWQVKVEVASVLGGFNDKRIIYPHSNEDHKTLVIKGSVVFGGGEIESI